jgi:hypothetical protein
MTESKTHHKSYTAKMNAIKFQNKGLSFSPCVSGSWRCLFSLLNVNVTDCF